ncbi:MAG: hypothetical protein K0S47_1814 [Herbinix sp.]|jgi:rubrerythrin|nr:hypothetical protein [Herbinix sp.]
MEFQDSRTYNNLIAAYEDELMLSTRSSINADIARNSGYMEINNIFDSIARNNKEHARIWLRHINGGTLPDLSTTLYEAMQSENEMANTIYQEFSRIAREEGYDDIAALFSGVANIDYNHGIQLKDLYEDLVMNQIFCKPETRLWVCMQCGNIMSGNCAPDICPVCGFPQGFYRLYE